MFTNKQLKDMILPLFFEQLLVVLVGIADTFIVSFCGEAAVSGVSLVNSFNTVFIFVFTALASGGAVVVSQYLGRGDTGTASEAVSQLLTASALFALVMTAVVLAGGRKILTGLFGRVDDQVMEACVVYLRISAYSYPVLAVYSAGTALCRSVGKTAVTMYISILANGINLAGNCIGVFLLHMGVAGVAWPSLAARVFSALAVMYICFQDRYEIRFYVKWIFQWNRRLQRTMMRIAIPNGIESGIFQLVKVALSSLVAGFGTYQIAANGIAQSFWSMASLVCVAAGPVFIMVVGQCMGAGDGNMAQEYIKRLLRITVIFGLAWNGLILTAIPIVLGWYAVSGETRQLVMAAVFAHNLFSAFIFPFAEPLGKGLRAAGDVRFTVMVAVFATAGVRLFFAWVFASAFNMGLMGVVWSMALDWAVRGALYWARFKSGKWKTFKVIRE